MDDRLSTMVLESAPVAPVVARTASLPPAAVAALVADPRRRHSPVPPLALLRQLNARMTDQLPAGRVVALTVLCGLLLRISSSANRALELVPAAGGRQPWQGLAGVLRTASRRALRQKRRAELLVRIESLRRQLAG